MANLKVHVKTCWKSVAPRERKLIFRWLEIFSFAIFLIIFIRVANTTATPSMYHFTQTLKQMLFEREFNTTSNAPINFNGIKSANDVWHFIRKPFLNAWSEDPGNPFFFLHVNSKVLGKPRMRQLKVRDNSCDIHEYFRRQFIACYGRYSKENEDTATFMPKGGKVSPAWNYSKPEDTGSMEYTGKVATYDGGGFIVEFPAKKEDSEALVKTLFDGNWITRGTRCIFIDFTVYNANLNLFCIVKIIFEFPPTGGVIPSYSINTLKFMWSEKVDESIKRSVTTLLVFMAFYTLCHLLLAYLLRWKYLKDFWHYWEFILLSIGFGWVAFTSTREEMVKKTLEAYTESINTKYIPAFEYAAVVQAEYNYMTAVLLFLICIKIFKFLSLNHTLGQLNNTLHECAADVFAYSFVFFIIFFAFTELGCLLFSVQVEGFSSFGASMFTLLRAILGDFNYMEIYTADAVLAPVFFLSYICFVFFVLLNIFLAIISDTHTGVKAEDVVAPKKMTMSQFVKKHFIICLCKLSSRFAKRRTQHFVYIRNIRKSLENCHFSENARNWFYEMYQIDPDSKRGKFDVNILLASLPQRMPRRDDEYVFGKDVQTQQKKLAQTELVVARLTLTIDALLKKMDTIRNIRKGPRK